MGSGRNAVVRIKCDPWAGRIPTGWSVENPAGTGSYLITGRSSAGCGGNPSVTPTPMPCRADDGFDLSGLIAPFPSSYSSTDGYNNTIVFQVCAPLPFACNGNSYAEGCITTTNRVDVVVAGAYSSQRIYRSYSMDGYVFQYTGGENGRSVVLQVACDPNQSGPLVWKLLLASVYKAVLTTNSRLACKRSVEETLPIDHSF